jgi:hypothetical protein
VVCIFNYVCERLLSTGLTGAGDGEEVLVGMAWLANVDEWGSSEWRDEDLYAVDWTE